MKIQQENIREYPKIRKIREHFLLWTIPVIRYISQKIFLCVHCKIINIIMTFIMTFKYIMAQQI